MADFEIGQNDTLPIIESTLRQNGTPVDLGAIPGTTVRFHMRKGATVIVDQPALIVGDGSTGIVRYLWQAGNTAAIGNYSAEWEITFAPGQILTIPRKPKITIAVFGELA